MSVNANVVTVDVVATNMLFKIGVLLFMVFQLAFNILQHKINKSNLEIIRKIGVEKEKKEEY